MIYYNLSLKNKYKYILRLLPGCRPKYLWDPSSLSNCVVLGLTASDVDEVLKLNTKNYNPNKNSRVPSFQVANYASSQWVWEMLFNILFRCWLVASAVLETSWVTLQGARLISYTWNTFVTVCCTRTKQINQQWMDIIFLKYMKSCLFLLCILFFIFFSLEQEVLTWSFWPLCYFNIEETNHTVQQMDQQGIRGQPPQVSYYHAVCPYYSIWKPSRSQPWPTRLPVG